MKNPFKVNSNPYKFFELAQPNDNGISRWVTREEWEAIGLKHSNGGDWNRSDGSLAKNFVIEKQYTTTGTKKIAAIRLNGHNNTKIRDHSIPDNIRNTIVAKPSTILYVHSQNECDHKDARYPEKATKMDQFQCLSKAENDAKRQHCKVCRQTCKRFDARVLGYKQGWIKGDENSEFCEGCWWYDPYKFNEVISNNVTIN